MKEKRNCHVSSCKNAIHSGGYVCTTHRYRFKKYNSYDLPGYTGKKSTLNIELLPDWASGKCKKHGYLQENEMYRSQLKNEAYKTKGCRRCVLDRNIKKKYGFKNGIDEFDYLAKKQGYKCKICKEVYSDLSENRSTRRKLSIDHCHLTGKFRGIICSSCNVALGYFKDSIPIMKSAIKYLQKHG